MRIVALIVRLSSLGVMWGLQIIFICETVSLDNGGGLSEGLFSLGTVFMYRCGLTTNRNLVYVLVPRFLIISQTSSAPSEVSV